MLALTLAGWLQTLRFIDLYTRRFRGTKLAAAGAPKEEA